MNLPRRIYYYKDKESSSDQALEARIGDIGLEFPGYGYCRVNKKLRREGKIVNHKRVARIMCENVWLCHPRRRKWVTTTTSNDDFTVLS